MQNRGIYVMQDQVRNRVYSIMAYDGRHPDRLRHYPPARMWVGVALTVRYIGVLAVSA